VASTGCAAATTGGRVAASGWVALLTAVTVGSVACTVADAVPVLLDGVLIGDGVCASAEDTGAESTGAGDVELVAEGMVGGAVDVVAGAAAPESTFVASELAAFDTEVTTPVTLEVVGVLTPSADARLDPRSMTTMTTSAPNPRSRKARRRNTKDALLSSGIRWFIRHQRGREWLPRSSGQHARVMMRYPE
jgi:hypothetical protein